MSFLFSLKAKLWALGGVLLAILAAIGRMKMLEHQRDKARARAKVAEAERDQERDHAAIAKQIRAERKQHRAEAVEQVMAGNVPDSLGGGINEWD